MKSGDQWLIDGLERGQADAIEAFVDRYGGWIHRVAARLLSDPRDAEEVTQDVLMTVVQKIETFKRGAALSSWVYRIATNAAYDRLRSRRARAEVPLDPLLSVFDNEGRHVQPVVDWSSQLEDPAVAGEAKSALERGIGRLAEEYRVVLVLRDVEGLANEEAAGALGLSVAALKSRLHRARLFLRRELGQFFSVRDATFQTGRRAQASDDRGHPAGGVDRSASQVGIGATLTGADVASRRLCVLGQGGGA